MFVQTICLVRFDEAFEHFETIANSLTSLGVSQATRMIEDANLLNVRDDVNTIANGRVDRFEMVMFRQHDAVGFQHQRITVVALGFRESTVDRDGLPAAFQR